MTTPAAPAPSSTAAPKGQRSRWRPSFSLRTLLVVTTLLGVLLGRAVHFHRQREEAARCVGGDSSNFAHYFHLRLGEANWLREAAYLLTGEIRWLRRSNIFPPAQHANFTNRTGAEATLDDSGVRSIRRLFPASECTIVMAVGRRLTASESVLAEAPPIPVADLDLDAANPEWLRLFAPRDCYLNSAAAGPRIAELIPLLEASPQLQEIVLRSTEPELIAGLAASPGLCEKVTVCKIENALVDDLRRLLTQAQRLHGLTVHVASAQEVRRLGPFPPQLEYLYVTLRPGPRAARAGLGSAIRAGFAQRAADLYLQVGTAPEDGLQDDDLHELLRIPRLKKLTAHGHFSADGLALLPSTLRVECVLLDHLEYNAATEWLIAESGAEHRSFAGYAVIDLPHHALPASPP